MVGQHSKTPALLGLGLVLAAACDGASGDTSKTAVEGDVSASEHPLHLSSLLRNVVARLPPGLATRFDPPEFDTRLFLEEGEGSETGTAILAVVGGIQGYVFSSTATGIGGSHGLIRRLNSQGEELWRFAMPRGVFVSSLRPYRGKFTGYLVAGQTTASCGDGCTPDAAMLAIIDETGRQRAIGYYDGHFVDQTGSPGAGGPGKARFRAAVQVADGTIVAVGDTQAPGPLASTLNTATVSKQMGISSTYVVLQSNRITDGRLQVSESVAHSFRHADFPTIHEGTLHDAVLLSDNATVVAVGAHRAYSSERFWGAALVLTPAGSRSWSNLGPFRLRGMRLLGDVQGDTVATAVAAMPGGRWAMAGYTTAFARGREQDLGFIGLMRISEDLIPDTVSFGEVDRQVGAFMTPTNHLRLFGGSVDTRFNAVALVGDRIVAAGTIRAPWDDGFYWLDRQQPVHTANGFVGSIALNGSNKRHVSYPSFPAPGDARPYDAQFFAMAGTFDGGAVVTGWRRPANGGHMHSVVAKIDATLAAVELCGNGRLDANESPTGYASLSRFEAGLVGDCGDGCGPCYLDCSNGQQDPGESCADGGPRCGRPCCADLRCGDTLPDGCSDPCPLLSASACQHCHSNADAAQPANFNGSGFSSPCLLGLDAECIVATATCGRSGMPARTCSHLTSDELMGLANWLSLQDRGTCDAEARPNRCGTPMALTEVCGEAFCSGSACQDPGSMCSL